MSFNKTLEAIIKSQTQQQQVKDKVEKKSQVLVNVYENPRAIVLRNIFGQETNEKILQEAVANKKYFKEGTTGGGLNKKLRSNQVCYYDEIYAQNRASSVLLSSIETLFKSKFFLEVVGSAGIPFCDFAATTTHETQVSRYGGTGEGQHYHWHIDRFGANINRHISFVYYFFKQPKKFQGGYLQLSNGVIVEGQLQNPEAITTTFEPENDMAVLFASTSPHCVLSTTSPTRFDYGRFSVNCWIGFR